MGSVSSTLKLFDHMSKPLRNMMSGVNMTSNSMDKLAKTLNQNIKIESSLKTASNSARNFGSELNNLSNNQNRASNSQNKLNNSLNTGSSNFAMIASKAKGLALAYVGLEAAKQGMNIIDNYVNQNARLDLINDGLQTQAQLQAKIYQSAQRSKAVYNETVSSVSKLGLLAKDAFSGNDEVIAFTELMNKAFRISGASTSEASNGMYQLTQAMASGRLQGDEFRSIMENAPMLAQAIADYTKVSMGELRKLSSEGKISSNIIKNALFGASNDINKKFESMPRTFSSTWVSIKNTAIMQFSAIMQKINGFLNSDTGAAFIQGITIAIQGLVLVTNTILNIGMGIVWVFNTIGQVIKSNWDIIGPILMFITGVLLVVMLQALWALLPALWGLAVSLSTNLLILQQTIYAWAIANWWIILIVLAIGILITILNQCGVTFEQVCGFIGGVFGSLFALIYNIIAILWNAFASFAEFFANLFIDPVYAVKKLFYDLSMTVLGWIANLAKGLTDLVNMIPGVEVNLHSGLDNMMAGIKVPESSKGVVKIPRMEQKDYKASATKGYNKGSSIGSSIKNTVGKIGNLGKQPNKGLMPGMSAGKGLDKGLDKNLKGANGHLKNIDDKIDISNEHLEMMRDIAEKESIQNFVTLTPTVQVTTGDIREEADINKIISKIETYMENQLVSSAEGVYA